MREADVAARVPSGGFVYISGNAATPRALLEALAARDDLERPVRLGHVLLLGRDPFAGREHSNFRHHAWFVGPADRVAVNAGLADYVPVHLHEIPGVIRRGPPLDVALIAASPPDEHGFMSLGVECMAARAAIERAREVYVQVNAAMPRVHGDAFVHVREVTGVVERDEPLPELVPPPATEVEKAIAAHIAALIPDGATLQLGIGGIPDAVLGLVSNPALATARADLGIHTEMISDGLLAGVEGGLITGRRKSLHAGKIVITFAMGSRRLYDFLADNPVIEAHPCDYVNDPAVIARNDRMVAINSALSVDLTGQVNADSLGTEIYSGFGGQLDFIRGAAAARDGVPIIALPATAKRGALSRVVPLLEPGAGVVTTRADVHWVVTEHGAANLHGLSLRERAAALIELAAPQFRDELRAAARERKLLG
ncbi:MAG: acetyl-CoA hydrolase/transferase family protein [Myxococcales bacterium]|nr:acetyl-CoA hydrolase/transferase family protein [Myxococcales bacterium]